MRGGRDQRREDGGGEGGHRAAREGPGLSLQHLVGAVRDPGQGHSQGQEIMTTSVSVWGKITTQRFHPLLIIKSLIFY